MQVVVVGSGRVASALAAALASQPDVQAYVVARDEAAARRLADEVGATALAPAPPGEPYLSAVPDVADLVVLAVTDDAIGPVAEQLAAAGAPARPGAAAVHVSGATGLDALAPLAGQGWATGCWHPFQAFPTPQSPVRAGTLWTITTAHEDTALAVHLEHRSRALGGVPHTLAEEHRAAYHAAASLAVLGAVAAIAQADEILAGCGLADAPTVTALTDLVRGSVDAAAELGPARALTGPLARADLGTLARHRAALADHPRAGALYAASGHAAAPLLHRRGLAGDVVAQVTRAIDPDGSP